MSKFRLSRIMIFSCFLVLFFLGLVGYYYVFIRMGDIPDYNEKSKFVGLPYYKDHFVSRRPFAYYPQQIQGGSHKWFRFLLPSPHAPHHKIFIPKITKTKFPYPPASSKICWLGHSSALIDLGGSRLCIDPIVHNAAPVPFFIKRYIKSPLSFEQTPHIDYILITHDHYDHLEYSTIQFYAKTQVEFIVPLGVGAILRGWGIPSPRIHELRWGQSFTTKSGTIITSEEANHFSGRSFSYRNQTLWCSYVLEGNGQRIFWSGDSGYTSHFSEIGNKYHQFDLVCLEIDAWNSGWPSSHLFPNEVIQAYKDLHAKRLMPIHWGVFDLALHPWDESINTIEELAKKEQIPLFTPEIGIIASWETSSTTSWWKNSPTKPLPQKVKK